MTANNQHLLCKMLLERGDILKAVEQLEPLVEVSFSSKKYDEYLEYVELLLKCYAELLYFDKIEKLFSQLNQLVASNETQLTSKIYYSLAKCYAFQGEHKVALNYSTKAFSAGIENDNKEDACRGIIGIAMSYYRMGLLAEAMKEIYNLEVYMGVSDYKEIRLSANILRGHILRKMGKFNQALDILWHCYEYLKTEKSFYMYLSLLYGIGLTYADAGMYKEARNYLRLVKSSIDGCNFKHLEDQVSKLTQKIGLEGVTYDLVFNVSNHVVKEKEKGKIDFHNQFILLDLLELFLRSPGQAFTKEKLVQHVWKQSYNPAIHDNKIYVTIKRLRQLIEPDINKPKYIFRSKNGYYFNKEARVLLEDQMRREL